MANSIEPHAPIGIVLRYVGVPSLLLPGSGNSVVHVTGDGRDGGCDPDAREPRWRRISAAVAAMTFFFSSVISIALLTVQLVPRRKPGSSLSES
jgi:hypothetical protein